MNMRDKLTIVIPTSIIPSHPKTFVIEYVLASLYECCSIKDCRILVVCDQVPRDNKRMDKCLGKDRDNRLSGYLENLEKLKSTYSIEVIALDQWGGLPGVTRIGIELVKTKYVLMWQHDLKALRFIDMPKLLEVMDNHPIIQYVHFPRIRIRTDHKGTSRRAIKEVRKIFENADGFGIPLVRTSAWGDSPVLATKQHYLDLVLSYIDETGGIGQRGVEAIISRRYSKLIQQVGFAEAQRIYGCFSYGSIGDDMCVSHLDGRESRVITGRWKRDHWLRLFGIEQ